MPGVYSTVCYAIPYIYRMYGALLYVYTCLLYDPRVCRRTALALPFTRNPRIVASSALQIYVNISRWDLSIRY